MRAASRSRLLRHAFALLSHGCGKTPSRLRPGPAKRLSAYIRLRRCDFFANIHGFGPETRIFTIHLQTPHDLMPATFCDVFMNFTPMASIAHTVTVAEGVQWDFQSAVSALAAD